MAQNDLLKTPLHDWHVGAGARLVDFAGWSMPVQYRSIVEEHVACRSAAGLFDISHMGRLYLRGDRAGEWLDGLVTNRVATLPVGRARYALITNERGGTKDDVLVYRLTEEQGYGYLVVVNAANREKILGWFAEHGPPSGVDVVDRTFETGMIAFQGPKAVEVAHRLTELEGGLPLAELRYYRSARGRVAGVPALVSRTGYTGEDGIEVIVNADRTQEVWEALLEAAKDVGARPCGLGARDTLRLEAALPLYGHELTEEITPLEARLDFAVKLDKPDFIGKEALVRQRAEGVSRLRVGLVLEGKRIARQDMPVLASGQKVGFVSSGTFAPTLQKSIAMAFVQPGYSTQGSQLAVQVRQQAVSATVVELPFYKRPRS